MRVSFSQLLGTLWTSRTLVCIDRKRLRIIAAASLLQDLRENVIFTRSARHRSATAIPHRMTARAAGVIVRAFHPRKIAFPAETSSSPPSTYPPGRTQRLAAGSCHLIRSAAGTAASINFSALALARSTASPFREDHRVLRRHDAATAGVPPAPGKKQPAPLTSGRPRRCSSDFPRAQATACSTSARSRQPVIVRPTACRSFCSAILFTICGSRAVISPLSLSRLLIAVVQSNAFEHQLRPRTLPWRGDDWTALDGGTTNRLFMIPAVLMHVHSNGAGNVPCSPVRSSASVSPKFLKAMLCRFLVPFLDPFDDRCVPTHRCTT